MPINKVLSQLDSEMPQSKVRLYTQAFVMLEFIVSQLGYSASTNKFYLFNVLERAYGEFTLSLGEEYQLDNEFGKFFECGFELILYNENLYGSQAKLISTSQEAG